MRPAPIRRSESGGDELKGAEGDYRVQNPVTHLNGLQARLLDLGGAA
jgi:hypothetical protein